MRHVPDGSRAFDFHEDQLPGHRQVYVARTHAARPHHDRATHVPYPGRKIEPRDDLRPQVNDWNTGVYAHFVKPTTRAAAGRDGAAGTLSGPGANSGKRRSRPCSASQGNPVSGPCESDGVEHPPSGTHVFTWSMAEELAVAHMRHLGFADARRTAAGADGGLDVLATGAVAQLKHHEQPVGAPDVQRLRGVAHGISRPISYSRNGYTTQAMDFADGADVALFTFDEHNFVAPVNRHAHVLASNQGAGEVGELAALADANLALFRQGKATHAVIANVVAEAGARLTALRDRLEGGDRSTETLAETDRIDAVAFSSWVERFGLFLQEQGDSLESGAGVMDEVIEVAERGLLPQRDHLEDVARELHDWRSRQVRLARELASIVHVDPGDFLT